MILLIGIGNEYRRDDGVGLFIARAVSARKLANVEIIEASGEGAGLIEAWRDQEEVIVVDAVASGAAPGTLHRFVVSSFRRAEQGGTTNAQEIPARFFNYSSHAFGLAEAIAMARALKLLLPRLVVYGIEGADFGAGVGLSPAVEQAARQLIDSL